MYHIEFVPHMADVRMVIKADSQEEVFKGALAGMNDLIKKDFCDQNKPTELVNELRIHSPETSCLLVDFLNEVLSLSHINKAIYCEVEFVRLGSTDMVGKVTGTSAEDWNEDIKAVTYHEAELIKMKDGWTAKVLFDV